MKIIAMAMNMHDDGVVIDIKAFAPGVKNFSTQDFANMERVFAVLGGQAKTEDKTKDEPAPEEEIKDTTLLTEVQAVADKIGPAEVKKIIKTFAEGENPKVSAIPQAKRKAFLVAIKAAMGIEGQPEEKPELKEKPKATPISTGRRKKK